MPSTNSSSCLSRDSPASYNPNSPSPTNLDIVSLSKLSSHLERLVLEDPSSSFTDADVAVDGGADVGVHRCILAARSQVFRSLFARGAAEAGGSGGGGRPRYVAAKLLPPGARLGQEAFMVFLGYMYTGKLRPAPPEAATCVDPVCAHDACRPAVAFAVEMMYAAHTFDVPELVSLFQRRLLNFVEKTLVEDVIPILLVAFRSKLYQLVCHCVQRLARSNIDNVSLEKELPCEVVTEIKSIRCNFQINHPDVSAINPIREKRIRSIYGALDSDDVELVKLLLTESDITLDDATALHYAAAYCDSKVLAEILELDLANVNLKNERGYTPLHISAMRKEPDVILLLLEKGASVSETTTNGQDAVSICRRLTRTKDYYAKTIQGQESNKDRVCIDLLEREMTKNPTVYEDSVTSALMTENLQTKFLYLENRVGLARLLFPLEAKIVMKIAQAEPYSDFANFTLSKSSRSLREVDLNEIPSVQNMSCSQFDNPTVCSFNLRREIDLNETPSFQDMPYSESANRTTSKSSPNLKEVDLNETPYVQNIRLLSRVDALTRTVEFGRRYFPHCSQVLDRLMSDDASDLSCLQKGTPDEQQIKRMRFYKLQKDVRKAFRKDKAETGCPHLCSSS